VVFLTTHKRRENCHSLSVLLLVIRPIEYRYCLSNFGGFDSRSRLVTVLGAARFSALFRKLLMANPQGQEPGLDFTAHASRVILRTFDRVF
jgi:hypothetical protein